MRTVAVGIDVGHLDGRGLDLVALDAHRRIAGTIRNLRRLDHLLGIVEGLEAAVVCIDSPSQWAEAGRRRPAERELTRRGINLYTTPPEDKAGEFHHWMRDGFLVYTALAPKYPRYTGGEARGKAAEYYPHAATVALEGQIGDFASKVPIRRRLLADHGVDERALLGPDQVDAALGALTGLIALDGHTWVGEGEDAMLLPVPALPEKFQRIQAAQQLPSPSDPLVHEPVHPEDGERPPCLCGCGKTPKSLKSRFMPGHDHRLNPATGRRWNNLP